ncbi:site-2 protease family protein [Micrococcus terreus]|uniref:site-2 protease family protein n=1 Tax=Micrococcus terreus TaxID=574650 RepID=UPI003D72B8A8
MPDRVSRRGRIRLGRLVGVPVYLSWNWLLIAGFVVLLFGPQVARLFPELGIGAYGIAFLYAVLLALSVLVHELAHAVSARAFGWPAQEIVLNLWGGHTQFGAFQATPGRSLVTALAGPAANVLIALAGTLIAAVAPPEGAARLLLDILVYANWLVALFNVLPGLPLDGGRIVESAVWAATGSQDKGTVAAGWSGRGIVLLLALLLVVVPFLQGRPADIPLIVILVMVGFFLWNGASEAIRVGRLRQRVPHLWVGELMRPAVGVPASAPLSEVLAFAAGAEVVVLSETGRPEAVLDQHVLSTVPSSALPHTPVSAVARALTSGAVVGYADRGAPLVDRLSRVDGSEYAVIGLHGQVCGVLRQADVMRRLSLRRTER